VTTAASCTRDTAVRVGVRILVDCDQTAGHPVPDRRYRSEITVADVAAAIRELKAKPGGELHVSGSGVLVRWLLANDLVDEMNLFTFPMIVGQGTRLFPDNGPDRALHLVDSRATPSGVTIQVYRPTGRPQYATATADEST
jgi:dihydrofolate reductase